MPWNWWFFKLPPICYLLDKIFFIYLLFKISEGMMDISLLTANANQLKFIIYYNQQSMTFYPALSLIVLSLILQIAIGFLLIFRVSFEELNAWLFILTTWISNYSSTIYWKGHVINLLVNSPSWKCNNFNNFHWKTFFLATI